MIYSLLTLIHHIGQFRGFSGQLGLPSSTTILLRFPHIFYKRSPNIWERFGLFRKQTKMHIISMNVAYICSTVKSVTCICSTVKGVTCICSTVNSVTYICSSVNDVTCICSTVNSVTYICSTVNSVTCICSTVNDVTHICSSVKSMADVKMQQK